MHCTSPCRTRESRGRSRFGRGLGVSPAFISMSPCRTRESRGAQPLWQGSGGVPSPYSYSLSPQRGSPEGAAALAGVWGCPQPIFVLPQSSTRESRGRRPLAGVWGCPPLSARPGAERGSPEGRSRFGRGLGVSPAHIRTPSVLNAGVQRAPSFGRGLGMSPAHIRTPSVLKAGVQRAPPFGRGLGVSPAHIRTPSVLKAGVQRGTASLAGVWGCPAFISTSPCRTRESRGRRLFGRGLGVSCLYQHVPVQNAGVQRAPPLWQGSRSVPRPYSYSPGPQSGSPEGAALWQGSGDVPSPYSYALGPQRGSPEGHSLFGRGLGVSPRDLIFSPLPSRKGVRGMVRAASETTLPEAEVPRAATTPDCFAALAMTKGAAGRWTPAGICHPFTPSPIIRRSGGCSSHLSALRRQLSARPMVGERRAPPLPSRRG